MQLLSYLRSYDGPWFPMVTFCDFIRFPFLVPAIRNHITEEWLAFEQSANNRFPTIWCE